MSMAGPTPVADECRRVSSAFLGWQCRSRQAAMRDRQGMPDDAAMPALRVHGTSIHGRIVTVLNRRPEHSVLPEFRQISRQTMDPAKIREAALRFLSAGYYQKARRFSDVLTATFAADSENAARLIGVGRCNLEFSAHSHRFSLDCRAYELNRSNHLHEATRLHNGFFNPAMPPDVRIIGFQPDWGVSEMSIPGQNNLRASGLPVRAKCA